jgi:L-ribulose-5-phosphate 3-epimerase UlaE
VSLSGYQAVRRIIEGHVAQGNVIYTDAYELAVQCGFEGTVEEWLDSLKRGIKKVEVTADSFIFTYTDDTTDTIPFQNSVARAVNVTLLAARWVANNHAYSQVVEIDGITENSQVDLTPSVEQLAVFHEKDLTFVTENEDGVVTVYAIGQKPTNDYTIQATITEVQV